MKNVALMLVVCALAFKASAQDATDALRYSQITFGGTARGMGIGGAVGALGADVSDLAVNPAGLGLFRSSELEVTPCLYSLSTASNYLGNQSSSDITKLGIENFGLVFTHKVGEPSGQRYGRRGYREQRPAEPSTSKWKTVSFAIAYNRLNNFNQNIYYQSTVPSSNSITNFWANVLNSNNNNSGTSTSDIISSVQNGYPSDGYPFDAGLGYYEGVVINPTNSNTGYASGAPGGNLLQTQSDAITGSQNEFDISLGANYNDRWFIGLTIGVPTINFNSNEYFSEVTDNSAISNGQFQSLNYNYQLSTAGTGINAKVGLIYKVNDFLRLGIAAHTPTWYSMQDSYNSTITADIDSAGTIYNYLASSPLGTFNYNLQTPWRFIGSATILFKQYGFISADYEYVDYSQAYFNYGSDITDQVAVNQEIATEFNPSSIFRVGAEAAIDIFRLRGGFAYYGTPYQGGQAGAGGDQSAQSITGGIGVRLDHVFIDAAYVYTMSNTTYYPYSTADQVVPTYPGAPYTTAKNTSGNILLTLGYKF